MPSNPILAAALAIAGLSAQAQRPDPLPALQARVKHVESIRAIKRLQTAYGHYVELGLWNDFADLFTDSITNYSQGVRGKAEVRKLFFDQVGQGKLGLADGRIYPHILFQPVITLAPDGRSAKGRWRILAMLGSLGGTTTWYSGVYENGYVLENCLWKISVLRSEPKVTAAYTATGWKDSEIHVPPHYTAANIASIQKLPIQHSASCFSELAQRVARLNDQAEVTNVLDTYGYAIDRKQWDQAANLFAVDATLELGLQGVYVGKPSIRRGLNQFGTQGLNDHVYLQTLVSVAPDGRAAKASGVGLILSPDELSEGTFENSFIKQNGAWKIQSVHFYPRMIVDAATGWAKSAKPAPSPSKQFPPDRPPTSTYEIYPKFAVAPFHFDNPVTGKPPQHPAGVPSSKATTATPPPSKPARLAGVERNLTAAEAYDVAENLLNAYGYDHDDQESIFVDQVLQPVIDGAPDGKSAKIRARRLDLGGTSGGPGNWTAGSVEGQMDSKNGVWKFDLLRSPTTWTAPYPGGWASIY